MVAPPLVEPYIQKGRQLIEELKGLQFDVDLAFWLYYPESDEWRLVIDSPLYDKIGHRETLKKIQMGTSALPLLDVTVMSPKEPLVRALRKRAQGRPDESEVRVRREPMDGVFVEDALVYPVD